MILTPAAMHSYGLVFSFLLRLKRVATELAALWTAFQHHVRNMSSCMSLCQHVTMSPCVSCHDAIM